MFDRMSVKIQLDGLKKLVLGKQFERRHWTFGILVLGVLLISSLYLVNLSPYKSTSNKSSNQTEYVRATVLKVSSSQSPVSDQTIQVRIIDGQNKGHIITTGRNYIIGDPNSARLPVGSEVLLVLDPSNGNQYSYLDRYRIPGAITLFIVVLLLVMVIGRWRGFTGTVGLVISIGVLSLFVLPRIINGHAPFATCIEGAFAIAILSIFIAHGFNKRTAIALFSTLVTLALVVGLVTIAVYLTGVSGNPGDAVNADEQTYLIQYAPHHIDLDGLLMGGIVIASLGILEDITTAQTAAVDEIRKSSPKSSALQLYKSGLSVGREHIAALINTLILVYFGVALPTIVLTALYNAGPILVMINNEPIMEAIVRSAVTSIGLLLAVPLSTALAAYILPRWSRQNKAQIARS